MVEGNAVSDSIGSGFQEIIFRERSVNDQGYS